MDAGRASASLSINKKYEKRFAPLFRVCGRRYAPQKLFARPPISAKARRRRGEKAQGGGTMKLIRFGAPGKEKPGLIDAAGKIRDLSDIVADISGDALSPKTLTRL